MAKITRVAREVSKTVFLGEYVQGKRGTISTKAFYEAEVESELEAREVTKLLGRLANKDVQRYLTTETNKIIRSNRYQHEQQK